MECTKCGLDWPLDRFNPSCSTPTVCFRCRSQSVTMGIPNREHFHNTTDREAQRRAMAEARQQGHDPVPAWTTQYAGPVSV